MRPIIDLTLLLAVCVTLLPDSLTAAADGAPPNLIVIMTDDQGYGDVGFNGCRDIPTPHIDSIARSGVLFASGYVSHPFCSPSRAGLLTGRYQQRFGHERNPRFQPGDPGSGLPLGETTLADVLGQAGYRCGIVGKWHLGAHADLHPLKRGFHEFFGHLGGGHRYFPEELTIRQTRDAKNEADSYRLWIKRNHEPVRTTQYLTDEFSAEAARFVERHQDQPFFLYLAYNAPHAPLQASEKYLSRFAHIQDPKRRTYAAMVSAVDDGVGALLAKLRELEIEEKTLVFFLSDNGGPETVNGSDNGPLRGGKGDAWEGGIRVPFAAQWPGHIPAGLVYEHPVISLDIFATIAELAKVPPRPDRPLDGVNLMPYLTGSRTDPPHDTLYFRKFDQGTFAVRSGNNKLVLPNRGTTPQLFDLSRDIGETNNLAPDNSNTAGTLNRLRLQWNAQLIEPVFEGLQGRNRNRPRARANNKGPNVVLIVCDDLNISIGHLHGHPQAHTPHMDRLARTGVSFRHAYSNNPICAPSRSSFLTGIYPHHSKNFFFDKWFENPVLANSRTLMEHFRENGYRVVGSGKLMHHLKADVWDEFPHRADYGPFAYDGKERVGHPSVPQPFRDIGPVDGSFAPLSDVPFGGTGGAGWIYGKWGKTVPLRYRSEEDRDPTPDERNARWAAERIGQFAREAQTNSSAAPFFLGVGFIRPHTPLHVPKKYFDLFPVEFLKLPPIRPGDADDTHYRDVFNADVKGLRYYRTLGESYADIESGLKAFVQAYLASVAAVDDCIGTVVDAIDNSPFKENTIIIVTSDHGWNNGEKDYLFKNALWEESTRIPFIVRAPGVAKPGAIAEHPISLIDLYPTLADLCGLKGDTRKNNNGRPLDGHSVRPFLQNPKTGQWNGPDFALSMIYAGSNPKSRLTPEDRTSAPRQHWSLRSKRWRYILYNNGAEELYDHEADPHEWENLATAAEWTSIKADLRAQLSRMITASDSRPTSAP